MADVEVPVMPTWSRFHRQRWGPIRKVTLPPRRLPTASGMSLWGSAVMGESACMMPIRWSSTLISLRIEVAGDREREPRWASPMRGLRETGGKKGAHDGRYGPTPTTGPILEAAY
jgi:hypothetical protein